ncbi:unnamed protein product [Somion occarium]|uniref:NADP-dependent oxidoreductase domain-containing protein n=1 Tax=Somion occarium TaxID=3059160 RepID=A0ABP1DFI9_9APHY
MTVKLFNPSTIQRPKLLFKAMSKARHANTEVIRAALTSGFQACFSLWEKRVAESIRMLERRHGYSKGEFYLQSKFVPSIHQPSPFPFTYDPMASIDAQIRDAFSHTLKFFRVDSIDSYLLYLPLERNSRTISAWKTLAELQDEGKIGRIGVCIERPKEVDAQVILDMLEQEGGRKAQVLQHLWPSSKVVKYCHDNNISLQRLHESQFIIVPGRPAHHALRILAKRKDWTFLQARLLLSIANGSTPVVAMQELDRIKEAGQAISINLDGEDEKELRRISTLPGLV